MKDEKKKIRNIRLAFAIMASFICIGFISSIYPPLNCFVQRHHGFITEIVVVLVLIVLFLFGYIEF